MNRGTWELVLRARFVAGHSLQTPDGVREPLHEHAWQVEVFLEGGALDSAGLVADFTELQRKLAEAIQPLDGARLNDLPALAGGSPSTERVAQYIYDRFRAAPPPSVRIVKVRVWETADCAAGFVPFSAEGDSTIEPDARPSG